MQGASRAAFGQARDRLAALAARGEVTPPVGEELFGVVRLLDREAALRRALTDATSPREARAGLVSALLGDRVSGPTLDLVGEMVGLRWAETRDLADAAEELAVFATAAAADSEHELGEMEDALFRFGRIAAGEPELNAALTSPRLPPDVKRSVLDSLLAGKTGAASRRLIAQVVLYPRGRSLEGGLAEYARLAAAWRDRLIAVVRAAAELSDGERDRLTAALAAIYGHGVQLNIVVDPQVIGGMSVEIGDEVIDGTVSSLLAHLRRRLAA
jgi:F-type H+-transporting ATPase subunit delta